MVTVVWLPLLAQLIAPLALVAWLALRPPVARLTWALAVALIGGWLWLIALAGVWLAFPWWLWAVHAVVALPVAAWSFRRTRLLVARRPAALAGTVALALLVLAVAGLLVAVHTGRRAPSNAIDLAFPFRAGTYLVANGGAGTLINGHLGTLAEERFRPWRGQSYGVDLVRVDRLGRRARGGPLPADPASYFVFGDPVLAPCAGRVVAALDGLPDQSAGVRDRRHPTGNHVLLECGRVQVLLAHFRRGTVRVRTGELVATGATLGEAGNSGNSDEPHLHIHAQMPGTDSLPISGDALHLRLGGRWLVRNARVTAP